MTTLRDYQVRALAELAGHHRACLVMPTGGGKTVTAAEWARRQSGRGLWIAHRRELIDQGYAACRSAGLQNIEFRTIQELVCAGTEPPPAADFLVCDEAHHYFGTPQWSRALEPYANAKLLALTATPTRQDGAALGNLVDALVVATTVRELTERGYLVPAIVIAPPTEQRELAEHPVEAYKQHAEGRQTMVFAGTVDHARKLTGQFIAAGIPTATVEGSRPRTAELAAFRAGTLRIITSVHTMNEGVDLPGTSAVIVARGCTSQASWLQLIGRALRPSPGKTEAIVVDLRGSVWRHGLPCQDRIYSLSGKPIRLSEDKLINLRRCNACLHIWDAVLIYKDARCPGCGHTNPGKPDPAIRRAALERVRQTHTTEQRRAVYQQLRAESLARGYKLGRAAILFKVRYGRFPTLAEMR